MRSHRHARAAAAALVVALALPLSHAAAQNLLANPGFETGDLSAWSLAGPSAGTVFVAPASTFISFTGSFGSGYSLVHGGSYSASGQIATTPFSPFSLTQTVSVVPGSAYTVGFWLVNAGDNLGFGLQTSSGYTDIIVNGAPLLGASFQSMPAGSWTEFSAPFVAGSSTATVEFDVVGSGTIYAPVSVDDFYVRGDRPVSTPEPATLTLLGTGLLGLAAAARRRRTG